VAQRAVEADPTRPGLQGNLATFQDGERRPDLAEAAFKKAVSMAGRACAYLALSNFYRSGAARRAERVLRDAYAFAPRDVKLIELSDR